jgi:hypothetical protein
VARGRAGLCGEQCRRPASRSAHAVRRHSIPREASSSTRRWWGSATARRATTACRRPRSCANLDRKGLTLDELETLLHEFGHSLHNNLSATRYRVQAGTSVLRDFVEAPSQMLEELGRTTSAC